MNDDLPQIDTVDYDKSSGSSGGCVVAWMNTDVLIFSITPDGALSPTLESNQLTVSLCCRTVLISGPPTRLLLKITMITNSHLIPRITHIPSNISLVSRSHSHTNLFHSRLVSFLYIWPDWLHGLFTSHI
jgi:hypothetical protein